MDKNNEPKIPITDPYAQKLLYHALSTSITKALADPKYAKKFFGNIIGGGELGKRDEQ